MIAAGTSEITKRAAPTRRRLTKRSIEAIPTPESGRVAIFDEDLLKIIFDDATSSCVSSIHSSVASHKDSVGTEEAARTAEVGLFAIFDE